MKGVIVWRCKCGTRLKAETETKGGESAKTDQLAQCPVCREGSIILAEKVISVDTDQRDDPRYYRSTGTAGSV
jgi:hypothetical protein